MKSPIILKDTIIDNFAKSLHKEEFPPKIRTYLNQLISKHCNQFVLNDIQMNQYNTKLSMEKQARKRENEVLDSLLFSKSKIYNLIYIIENESEDLLKEQIIREKAILLKKELDDSYDSKSQDSVVKVQKKIIKSNKRSDEFFKRNVDINNILYHLIYKKEETNRDKKNVVDFAAKFSKKQ